MADSKISALSDGSPLVSTDALAIARSGTSLKVLGSGLPGYEIGYDQITGNVTVSSATEATGTTIITCAAHVFDGSPVIAEFFCAVISPGSGDFVLVSLFEGSTQIARFCRVASTDPGMGKVRFTPSAASHTYTVTGFRSTNNGTINAGAAGTAVYPPTFIRFTKA